MLASLVPLTIVKHRSIVEIGNYYLDSPVHLSTFRRVVRGNRLQLAEAAHRPDAVRSYSSLQQVTAN